MTPRIDRFDADEDASDAVTDRSEWSFAFWLWSCESSEYLCDSSENSCACSLYCSDTTLYADEDADAALDCAVDKRACSDAASALREDSCDACE
mgnify:CR=1 FL=1